MLRRLMGYLQQAAGYYNTGQYPIALSDKFRLEGITEGDEAWYDLRDKREYIGTFAPGHETASGAFNQG